MAKNKIYAVKEGNETGIFNNWEDCEKAIKGYSGALYKGFLTMEEATAYLNDEDIVMNNDIMPRLKQGRVVAFTDGTYDEGINCYGSGVYLILPDESIRQISLKGNNEKYVGERNIAGEVIAVFNAVDWAISNGYDKLSVFYDLQAIGEWANGNWKTKTICSQMFKNFVLDKSDVIDIEFQKVKGHSNNIYNDKADSLARGAIFEDKIFLDKENSGYIINRMTESTVENLIKDMENQYTGIIVSRQQATNKTMWIMQLENNKLNISLFVTKNKMVVQGKISNLFKMFTSLLIEKLECDNFIQILKNAYKISINIGEVNDCFSSHLPNIPNNVISNIELLLKQSIIDLNSSGVGDVEFSKYTFTALKALEAVLKHNLYKCNIPMTSSSFNMFDKDSFGIHVLQNSYKSYTTQENASKIENCYNHYYNQRHVLFHFGIILAGTDQNTKLIKTKKEANSIIEDTLKVINDNYIC